MFVSTTIFFFSAAKGCRIGHSCHASPTPVPVGSHQSAAPFGKKICKKRFGYETACALAARGASEASHGKVRATPAPRKTVLRLINLFIFRSLLIVRRDACGTYPR